MNRKGVCEGTLSALWLMSTFPHRCRMMPKHVYFDGLKRLWRTLQPTFVALAPIQQLPVDMEQLQTYSSSGEKGTEWFAENVKVYKLAAKETMYIPAGFMALPLTTKKGEVKTKDLVHVLMVALMDTASHRSVQPAVFKRIRDANETWLKRAKKLEPAWAEAHTHFEEFCKRVEA